jgi:hypothetical protein
MSTQLFNLPVNVPWKLVASSSDMIDRRPYDGIEDPWRSSLAVFAFEPRPEDVDPALCDQRLTFLEVTCSITGIQHDPDDGEAIRDHGDRTSGVDRDWLEEIAAEYFACYGCCSTCRCSRGPRGRGRSRTSRSGTTPTSPTTTPSAATSTRPRPSTERS